MRRAHLLIAGVVAAFFFTFPATATTEQLVRGTNSIVTAPFDVVAGLIEPHRYFDAKMANVVLDRVGGVVHGVETAGLRVLQGVADIALFWLPNQHSAPYSADPRFCLLCSVDAE